MLRSIALFLLVLLVGCDSRDPVAMSRPVKEPTLELRSILSLRANQRTHLVVGTGSQLYFFQPDVVSSGLQRLDANGEVKPTALTPQRVSELLGEKDAIPSLRAIESLGDGRIIAYFNGASRRRSLSCVVLFEPIGENVRMIIPPEELARSSGMGITLDLADAQLARAGNTLWLWLRHVDQSAFLTLDVRSVAAGSARLARPFEQIKTDEGPLKFAAFDALVAQRDETLWLFRPGSGELWRISRDGQAFMRNPPEGHPKMSVAPLLLRGDQADRGESWLYFFPAEEILLDDRGLSPQDENAVRYPAVLTRRKSGDVLIDRDHLEIRPAFPRHALRFAEWVLEPATGDVIAYDRMSGEVFRIVSQFR